ncbi:MAG: hypothetical protein ACHQ52_05605 [Candidatus Eisenbacteria bacterium]
MVSYFAEARDKSNGMGVEWHLLDPATRVDSVLVALASWPAAVRISPSHTEAAFALGGALQHLRWEWGAQPWPEVVLPTSPRCIDVWFDRRARCWWLVSGDVIYLERNAFPGQLCRYDFWRGTADGKDWSIARRETTSCVTFSWRVWASTRNIDPDADTGVGLWARQTAMTPDQWGLPPQPIPPPRGQSASGPPWYFVGSRTSNGLGLAYRMEPSHGETSKDPAGQGWFVTAPFVLMDRVHGSERVLDVPNFGPLGQFCRLGMEERDGFVLVSGDRAYLFDLRTGEQLLPGSAKSPIVWVPRPAPMRVDTAGLTRLRARFETKEGGPHGVR